MYLLLPPRSAPVAAPGGLVFDTFHTRHPSTFFLSFFLFSFHTTHARPTPRPLAKRTKHSSVRGNSKHAQYGHRKGGGERWGKNEPWRRGRSTLSLSFSFYREEERGEGNSKRSPNGNLGI